MLTDPHVLEMLQETGISVADLGFDISECVDFVNGEGGVLKYIYK